MARVRVRTRGGGARATSQRICARGGRKGDGVAGGGGRTSTRKPRLGNLDSETSTRKLRLGNLDSETSTRKSRLRNFDSAIATRDCRHSRRGPADGGRHALSLRTCRHALSCPFQQVANATPDAVSLGAHVAAARLGVRGPACDSAEHGRQSKGAVLESPPARSGLRCVCCR